MRLDDGVGYDDPRSTSHDQSDHDHQAGRAALPGRRGVWVALAAGVVVALGLLFVITPDGPSAEGLLPVSHATVGSAWSAEATTPAGTRSAKRPSVSLSGGDASQVATTGAPGKITAAPTRVATLFMRGWLDPAPTSRRAQLEQSATAQLVTGLMRTDPAAIPTTAVVSATLVGQSATAAEFTILLADNDQVELLLAADPQAPHGWWVVSVTDGTI